MCESIRLRVSVSFSTDTKKKKISVAPFHEGDEGPSVKNQLQPLSLRVFHSFWLFSGFYGHPLDGNQSMSASWHEQQPCKRVWKRAHARAAADFCVCLQCLSRRCSPRCPRPSQPFLQRISFCPARPTPIPRPRTDATALPSSCAPTARLSCKCAWCLPQVPLGEGWTADTLGSSFGDAAGHGGRASAAV